MLLLPILLTGRTFAVYSFQKRVLALCQAKARRLDYSDCKSEQEAERKMLEKVHNRFLKKSFHLYFWKRLRLESWYSKEDIAYLLSWELHYSAKTPHGRGVFAFIRSCHADSRKHLLMKNQVDSCLRRNDRNKIPPPPFHPRVTLSSLRSDSPVQRGTGNQTLSYPTITHPTIQLSPIPPSPVPRFPWGFFR